MEVFREGVAVKLTPQELKMLRFFAGNQARVISDGELLRRCVGRSRLSGFTHHRNPHSSLRQKLEKDPGNPIHLRTVHGAGYKFMK